MSIFPITPLVREVQALILQTFDVSDETAQNYAAELVALAEGWGSKSSARELDWSYRIKKDLGEGRKLKWRSGNEREAFEKNERGNYEAWDALIRNKRADPPLR